MRHQAIRALPLRQRLTVRLTGAVILVLLLIGVPFLFAFHRLLRAQELDAHKEAADGLAQFVTDSLRSSMLVGQPHLLDASIRKLSNQEGIERIMVLDHSGRVKISSSPGEEGRPLHRESNATCRICHLTQGSTPKSRTVVTRDGGRRIFRAMSVVPNELSCHSCHDPDRKNNGIILVDLALGDQDRSFLAGIGGPVALGGVMVVLTVLVLVLLLRSMVHQPLRAVVEASQRVVQGDMDARSPESGPGEFSLLAFQVNRMTDHLARSLKSVEEHRRELQEILDAVDDEIVVLDRNLSVVAANRAFRSTLRESGPDAPGHPCRTLSRDGRVCTGGEVDDCPVRRVFETGRTSKAIMTRQDLTGEEHTLEIHASPLRSDGGSLTFAVEVRRDISDRRQMEAVLAHSEHMASLGLLATGLSHEINNPLGAIATSVEGLRRKLSRGKEEPADIAASLEPALRRIAEQVDRGRAITGRLLRVSRPAGLTRSLIDVNHSIREIVALLSHDIRRNGVELDLDLAQQLPPLREDESRLGQILMNLCMNAIQAMAGSGGKLSLTTSSQNGTVRIEVRDTGAGIPPELRKRIFEPFFTTKPAGKGTGLGLFITHRLVDDMDGTISVESDPSMGTRFSVTLPLAAARDDTS